MRDTRRPTLSSTDQRTPRSASSGVLLLLAALVALALANSPLRRLYQAFWHTPIGLHAGPLSWERDLQFWINDGLMTVFFFVIGLEIRREIHGGELSQIRRAALPVVAAIGGMLVPALVYLAFAHGASSVRGWAVPVATDIAFAVGLLGLLGKRVSPALRVLLLALAVVDDLGAMVVIAAFYSAGIGTSGLLMATAGLAGLLALQKLGVRSPAAYFVPAVVIWAGAQVAGVHPTLAGVLVGLATPVVAPVERLQLRLDGWVAYLIMPLFALANAGVPLGGASFQGEALLIFLGVTVGLAAGKPLGIVAVTLLATRLGLTVLPAGVGWRQLLVVGQVAGIGFTMALFIAALAFPPGPLLETAKLAILSGSALAAVAGLAAGRLAQGGTSHD
jgi:Na+:H+ antiporter, NhaA family